MEAFVTPRPPDHIAQLRTQATLLVLGASAFQVPAILQARRLGCRVVVCDHTPQNPGHRLADTSVTVSTTDFEGVLALARAQGADGVLAYASDPAALTAARVAEVLGLPGSPADAVATLTDKPRFRQFLHANGFRAPHCVGVQTAAAARVALREVGLPAMVKPADSSGSKGVGQITDADDVATAFDAAQAWSRSGEVVIESWIRREGAQVAGDGLVVDGRLVFGGFGDEHFDPVCSPFAPVGESYPGTLAPERRVRLIAALERLFGLLGVRDLVFNLDAAFTDDGEPILLEVGPRAGGNALPQLIALHTGVDLTDIAIRQALGLGVSPSAWAGAPSGCFASHILHARRPGVFCGVRIDPELHDHLVDFELTVKPGRTVAPFGSSADTLGFGLFRFPDVRTMALRLSCIADHFSPVLA
ncbi:MAG: carbamoyl-phosphate-synthetase [Gammaproteobacteria bacterium]|nr:carbamoyl-phosphate-synthetase [Gammaproteobacteria bacterium]